MPVTRLVFPIFLCVAAAIFGCAPGKRPFLIAQVCLGTAEDVATFRRELESIAQSEGVRFIDDGLNTQSELRETMTRPVINMGMERGHGIGLTARNVGSPAAKSP
jgi:hypothetical protein